MNNVNELPRSRCDFDAAKTLNKDVIRLAEYVSIKLKNMQFYLLP